MSHKTEAIQDHFGNQDYMAATGQHLLIIQCCERQRSHHHHSLLGCLTQFFFELIHKSDLQCTVCSSQVPQITLVGEPVYARSLAGSLISANF